MKRAGKFALYTWQDIDYRFELATNEEDLHECGTSACFGGWIASSPEFQADGGWTSKIDGAPTMRLNMLYGTGLVGGSSAIAYWLDIEDNLASQLCGVNGMDSPDIYEDPGTTTKEEVIMKLEELLKTGDIKCYTT